MSCVIWKIREHPELLDRAAAWFHEKWGVPLEAYRESMAECCADGGPAPQRYGWRFLCMVQGDGEAEPSRMYAHTQGGKAGQAGTAVI